MSSKEGSGGFRKRKHDDFPHNRRREGKYVNSSSPVMVAFKSFQLELDARHDKYERLVKLSRDLTVESKRTIFLLHRITSTPDTEEILTESEIKLDGVRQDITGSPGASRRRHASVPSSHYYRTTGICGGGLLSTLHQNTFFNQYGRN
jgi:hypothetical protein